MKTASSKKVTIKVESESEQNVRINRKLKTVQPTTLDKENLTGRPQHALKESKLDVKKPKPSLMHKAVQTDKYVSDIDDLTGEEASIEYWKTLAEKRQETLDESLHEVEKLKEDVDALKEENRICKEMLEESRHLVQVFQEILNEDEDNEETESAVSQSEGN